jgi:hypothetical protein
VKVVEHGSRGGHEQHLHRLEGYLASNDPDFEAEAADIVTAH